MKRERTCDNIDGEKARLAALRGYDILDTAPEEAFDRIARLVETVFDLPVVLVSLIDADRQWFKSKRGFNASETSRRDSFCTHTIARGEPFVVTDTHADPRFAQSPLVVGEPQARFYVGVPLRTRDGHNIGTLCAMDTKTRELHPDQIRTLEDLARIVVDALELRQLATLDSLTGALTRRSLHEQAQRDVERSITSGRPLSCAVIDVDNFKAINDANGHAAGDLLLQHIAAKSAAALRETGYLGRIGGDEFVLMLPDTLLLDAFEIADALRKKIAGTVIEASGRRIAASVSIGIAELTVPDDSVDQLLRNADAALYDAKLDGKDRVACYLADLKFETGFEAWSAPAIVADDFILMPAETPIHE